MCDKFRKPEWKSDPRFITNNERVRNRDALEPMIEEVTKSKTTQEWLEILDESGIPYAAVNDVQGTLNDELGRRFDNISLKQVPEADSAHDSSSTSYSQGGRTCNMWTNEACQYNSQVFIFKA
jgi:crotonobetainyl-CoA:carnitine CoA-transferase CaiB-like acyl-CoA transferase